MTVIYGIKRCKRIKGYLLLRPIQMSLQRQMAWGSRLVWSCTAEINEEELCHRVQGGRTEAWAGGGLKSGTQNSASPETIFPFCPSLGGESCKNLLTFKRGRRKIIAVIFKGFVLISAERTASLSLFEHMAFGERAPSYFITGPLEFCWSSGTNTALTPELWWREMTSL